MVSKNSIDKEKRQFVVMTVAAVKALINLLEEKIDKKEYDTQEKLISAVAEVELFKHLLLFNTVTLDDKATVDVVFALKDAVNN